MLFSGYFICCDLSVALVFAFVNAPGYLIIIVTQSGIAAQKCVAKRRNITQNKKPGVTDCSRLPRDLGS